MKRGLVIFGECFLLIVVLIAVKVVLGKLIPATENNDVVGFVMYFLAGMGSVLIYRYNTVKKE